MPYSALHKIHNRLKNSQGILLEERLSVNNVEIFNHKQNTLYIEASFPIDEKVKSNLSGENANNISIISFLLTSYPLAENHYLIQLQKFVNSMLWFRCLEQREFIGLESNIYMLDDYIIKNKLIEDFSSFIEKTSGQIFTFVTPNFGDRNLFCYIKGVPVIFDAIISTGTHSLMLLYFWIKRMGQASFVFVDEFDAFYHYKLSFEVCKQLFDLDSQVFLSSHNTYLMTNDLLRPDCNFVLDKNVIKPLSDCTEKDLRFGHNIEKLFRAGTFNI